MAIQAAEISAILKVQIKNFGQESEVAEVSLADAEVPGPAAALQPPTSVRK